MKQDVPSSPNNQEIFRQMTENIREIFWMLDAATYEVIYVSPAFETICGLPCQSLYDDPLSYRQIIHPDDRPRVLSRLEQLPTSGSLEEEFRIVRPDGIIRWVLARGFPAPDAEPQLTRLVGTVADITERKKTEHLLRESEAKFSKAFQVMPVGLAINTLGEGRFIEVNDTFVNQSGYTRGEVIGRTDLELGMWDDPSGREQVVREVVTKGRARGLEQKFRTKSGRVLDVRYSLEFIEVRGLPCVLSIAEDITEQRALEEQVRQKQTMEAAAMLVKAFSHDFNRLLAAILGYSELLLLSPGIAEFDRRKLEGILKAALLARSWGEQLLFPGRTPPLRPILVDVSNAVKDLTGFLRGMVGPNIDLALELQPGLMAVRIDSGHLTQLIINLVANARDAMSQDGKLTIKTYNTAPTQEDFHLHRIPEGNYVALSVSDTGCGMDPEIQARIFEPHFTTKPEGKGVGLGLAMVKLIVEESGGYIQVYSRPREGTRVEIFIPQAQDPKSPTDLEKESRAAASGCETVLLVDDDDLARNLTFDFLCAHGYKVLNARNGPEALGIANEHAGPIHLLITNIPLPIMSGPELASHLLTTHPKTKVLFMTDYTDFGLQDKSSLLRKPFLLHELMGRVRQILGQAVTH